MKHDYKQRLINNGYLLRHAKTTTRDVLILVSFGAFIGWVFFKAITGA